MRRKPHLDNMGKPVRFCCLYLSKFEPPLQPFFLLYKNDEMFWTECAMLVFENSDDDWVKYLLSARNCFAINWTRRHILVIILID